MGGDEVRKGREEGGCGRAGQREVCRDFCVKDRGKSSPPPPGEDEKGERGSRGGGWRQKKLASIAYARQTVGSKITKF